jgi:hypothetical protein
MDLRLDDAAATELRCGGFHLSSVDATLPTGTGTPYRFRISLA